jgi:hypothetical protein
VLIFIRPSSFNVPSAEQIKPGAWWDLSLSRGHSIRVDLCSPKSPAIQKLPNNVIHGQRSNNIEKKVLPFFIAD